MNAIETLKRTLNALESYDVSSGAIDMVEYYGSITNFRNIIEQMEKQEPVVWMQSDHFTMFERRHVGSSMALARCSDHKAMDDFKPLYIHPAPSVPEGWLRAIDEELVCTHLGVANANDSYEVAKAKLCELINWHTQVATDPKVNGGWKMVPIEPTDEMLIAVPKSTRTRQHYHCARPSRRWKK